MKNIIGALCILMILAGVCQCKISPIFPGEDQSSGFINIGENYELFYWLFKSRTGQQNAPFIFWIQGGPGCAGTSSVLSETGPFEITENITLIQRKYSINNFADVLFIDQPIGTGFSNTSNSDRIPKTEKEIVKDLLVFFNKFLALY